MPTPFVAGNWKMNLDGVRSRALAEALLRAQDRFGPVEVGVFPPYTLLADVARLLAGSRIVVGAQNLHAEPCGPHTGEICASMLADAGATHVIVGHSERRHGHFETDEVVHRKLRAAVEGGLTPILCVGETLAERDAGRTLEVVVRQLAGALEGLTADSLARLVVAYEPVWAIGTGRNATPDQAAEVHAAIRRLVAERFGAPFAAALRIQYGGSVNAKNARELLGRDGIDGALVGGASLEPDSFLAIVDAARETHAAVAGGSA